MSRALTPSFCALIKMTLRRPPNSVPKFFLTSKLLQHYPVVLYSGLAAVRYRLILFIILRVYLLPRPRIVTSYQKEKMNIDARNNYSIIAERVKFRIKIRHKSDTVRRRRRRMTNKKRGSHRVRASNEEKL